MKIYTKTGDEGETSLYGGDRVKKNNQRIVSYGTVDELNSLIGIVRSCEIENELKTDLIKIQEHLFVLGSELATPQKKLILANGKSRLTNMMKQNHIIFLENKIDEMDAQLAPMTHFILPGGNHMAEAYCQLSRTVCRRAEREVIALNNEEMVGNFVLPYLNRLSDYLFVLGRFILMKNNQEPIKWKA